MFLRGPRPLVHFSAPTWCFGPAPSLAPIAIMDTLIQDLRYAARKLLRTPGFTAVAVTTLALAIGATTSVFSIVNGVLLKPLPFREPDRLVRVASVGREGRPSAMSPLDFIDYRDQSHSFVGMVAINNGTINLTATGEQPRRLTSAQVGARFFEVLGVTPQLGRPFTATEDAAGAPRVVILSDKLWRGQFNADPRVVGRPISLDGKLYMVIGVAPPTLTYPAHADVWIPLSFENWMVAPDNRGAHFLSGVARLRPGVTFDPARHDVAAIAERLAAQYPESNAEFRGTIQPLAEQIVGGVKRPLYTLLGAVAFVLLIACANVANLLLV